MLLIGAWERHADQDPYGVHKTPASWSQLGGLGKSTTERSTVHGLELEDKDHEVYVMTGSSSSLERRPTPARWETRFETALKSQ